MYKIDELENYCKQAIEKETLSVRVNFFGNEGHFPIKNFINVVSDHLTDKIYEYINIREDVETKEQAIKSCKNAIRDCIHDAYFITDAYSITYGDWWIYDSEWKDIFTQYQDDINQIINNYGCLSIQEITRDSNTIIDMEIKLIEYAISSILTYYKCLCEEDDNVDMVWNEIVK